MREMSKAMLKEAEVDLGAAKDLHKTKKYSKAVVFCQQALENIAKVKSIATLPVIAVIQSMVISTVGYPYYS